MFYILYPTSLVKHFLECIFTNLHVASYLLNLFRYGFEKLGLLRIEILVQEDNKPSLRIADKLGAVREGLLRNRILIHDISYDAYMHSLIPEDIKENNIA